MEVCNLIWKHSPLSIGYGKRENGRLPSAAILYLLRFFVLRLVEGNRINSDTAIGRQLSTEETEV